jgi:CubicO group peptidase (beta-lactamase class C family)
MPSKNGDGMLFLIIIFIDQKTKTGIIRYATMPKTIILFIICLSSVLSSYAKESNDPKSKLERMMEYYAENDKFNGTVLVARKGEILLLKGYGYRDVAKRIRNDEHTIFQIGSNTKQFTAEAILQLDSKGKVGIDDKVSKYMPDFPNGDKITLKNLLTHTSGLYNYTSDNAFITSHAGKHVTREEVLDVFKNKPLAFVPGSRFEYSSSNYFLLGCLVEKIAGRKYEKQVREYILKVCEMTHSGFDFAHLRNEHKAIGYASIMNDTYKEAPVTDSTMSFAAGALYSTVDDLYKWHKALRSYRLLPKDWQEIAFIPFKNNYGLGWAIETMFGKKFELHDGAIDGFTSFEVRQEQDDVFVVLLQNNAGSGADNSAISKNIIKVLYDKNFKIPGSNGLPVCVNPGVLKTYVGEYELTPDFSISISFQGNSLFAEGTGQPLIQLVPETQTMFHTLGVDAHIEFVKDNNGTVQKLVLNQNGQHLQGIRKK